MKPTENNINHQLEELNQLSEDLIREDYLAGEAFDMRHMAGCH
jgi:hypothetical protein